MRHFFTSESVTEGHPDKICDQISDAVLDAILAQDPDAHVACECAATTGMVLVMGEISTSAYVPIDQIVRSKVVEIGSILHKPIMLLGGKDVFEEGEQVVSQLGERATNGCGKYSLYQSAAILQHADCVITGDTGLMHIAAALQVPCVANFGSTDPEKTGPYGPAGRHYVVRSQCAKAPCFSRECPLRDRLACSRQANAEEAANAILERMI